MMEFDIRPIQLGHGWAGLVLAGFSEPGTNARWTLDVPPVDAWRPFLATLTSDPSRLRDRVILKHSDHGEVFRACLADDDATRVNVVCKASSRAALFRRFRPSRERRNWERSFRLLRAGVNTALPLVLLDRSAPRSGGWLITAALPDVVDLDQIAGILLHPIPSQRARSIKTALIRKIADLLNCMEQAGLWHRDCKASNILATEWTGTDGGPHLWLVDLDGVHRRLRLSSNVRWRPVIRLAASLVDHASVTRTDFLRFLLCYLQRVDWKPMWRKLAAQVTLYNRRAAKRKRGKLDGFGSAA